MTTEAKKKFRLLINDNQNLIFCRTHFGAKSSGDRSKIVYRITKSPENGTLYWVAGEKEANTFTQRDVDEERVLYAQLNMQAFQVSVPNRKEKIKSNLKTGFLIEKFNLKFLLHLTDKFA